jgi:putative ABC transport system substrate-binding protein
LSNRQPTRRDCLWRALELAALSLLTACGAAQPTRLPRIGWLSPVNGSGSREFESVRQGLRDLGYIEGQTVAFESRLTDGDNARMPSLAVELVALHVDVIVTDGLAAALAARDATHTLPIVMGVITDPVGSGLVGSLGRPGGNITGFAALAPGMFAK